MATHEELVDAVRHVVHHYAKNAMNGEDAWVSRDELAVALSESPFDDYTEADVSKAIRTLCEQFGVDVRGPRSDVERENLFADGCEYRYNATGTEFFARFADENGSITVPVPE